jgi:hypothetical protein
VNFYSSFDIARRYAKDQTGQTMLIGVDLMYLPHDAIVRQQGASYNYTQDSLFGTSLIINKQLYISKMEKLICLCVIFIISLILFLIGYNTVFNTVKTISKFISLARYEEGTKMSKTLSSESNMHWVRICGVLIIVFALILFAAMIILLINRQCK